MTELEKGEAAVPENSLERLDQDLDIMERHADQLTESEAEIREALRRWDRDFKNERFHSVPKPRKHLR